jgi:hypothetical protein
MLPWASPLEGLLFRTPGRGLAAGPAPRRGFAGCRGTPAVRLRSAPVHLWPKPGGAGHSCDRPPSRGVTRDVAAGGPLTRPAPDSRRSTPPEGAAAGAASSGLVDRSGRLAILVASSRRDPRGPGGLCGAPPRPGGLCGAVVATRRSRRSPFRHVAGRGALVVSRPGPVRRRARGAFALRMWPFVAFGRSADARFGAAVRDGAARPVARFASARRRERRGRGASRPKPAGYTGAIGGSRLPKQWLAAYRGLPGGEARQPPSVRGRRAAWCGGLEGVTAILPPAAGAAPGTRGCWGWPLWGHGRCDGLPTGVAPFRPKPWWNARSR